MNFVEFSLNIRVVWWKGGETGERAGGIFVTPLLDEPSGRFWEEDHANGNNEGPDELDGDGDPPRSVRLSVFGGIVDDGSDDCADVEHPLVSGNDSTTGYAL